jgi:polysaccharide pyruvyl transferase WcaK-like protein
MQVFVLEIFEHWLVHENGKQREQKRRHVTLWTHRDDLLAELMKFLENKHSVLDDDLLFAARSITQSEGMTDWDKLVRVAALFNRFSKFATESNIKKQNYVASTRTTWLEISSIEAKLRGSVFE